MLMGLYVLAVLVVLISQAWLRKVIAAGHDLTAPTTHFIDRLQATIDKSQLLVLPLSIDRKGAPVVKQFYEELGLKVLGIYVDQSGKASSELSTVGVPTTLLIDRDGREIGRKVGPAEWDSPEMIALIREHLGLPASAAKAAQ